MRWLLLFLLFPIVGFSQTEGKSAIDSLKNLVATKPDDTAKVSVLNKLSYCHQDVDVKLGLLWGRRALQLAKKLKFNDGIAAAHRSIGMNLTNNGDYPGGVEEYKKGLKIVKSKKVKGECLRSLGLVQTYMGNYTEALENDMLALKSSEEAGDRKGQAAVLSNMGIVYYDLGDIKKAVQYYDRARVINEQMGNLTYLSNNLGNLGNCYSELRQYDKAIKFFNDAIVINDKLGDLYNKSINLSSLAHLYYENKDYKKANEYNDASLEINLTTGNDRVTPANYQLRADIFLRQSKAESGAKAVELANKGVFEGNRALKLNQERGDRNGQGLAYVTLAALHGQLRQFESAFEMQNQAAVFKDSIFNSDNKETIKNLEDRRAIELRDKQIELNRVKLESAERERWLYIGGLVMVIAIGFLLFMQIRNQRRNNLALLQLNSKLDEANQTKAKLFSIIGHDLRSSVSHIYQFLEIQKSHPEALSEADKIRHNDKITSSARILLDTMEDLLIWSKSQMQQFSVQNDFFALEECFEVISDLSTNEREKKNVSLKREFDESLCLETDRNMLEIILRNLVQNAIKVSNEDSEVILGGSKSGKQISVWVRNTGKPMPETAKAALLGNASVDSRRSGLGLTLIRELADRLGAKISVTSGASTEIRLEFSEV
ncbi:tetratricopeptide repeat-containing sensor histidine kinase [Flavobacterium sp.]|uniref:tetratricopeptide repeat-containing sensor histidine kinase n=1 Tax=Flavobacterium sp. TaxID=239 RepID=UPI00121F9164|nr:tetratricopeptide repeat-containing sensor histidine kinase [Flavobacterium sp.]RZJ70394.1 MAG: sensor histidine kinase [Flavobacterium sp.]